MKQSGLEKLRYLFWAFSRIGKGDTSCPSCRSISTRQIYRKALITALFECNACGLRFRVPKDVPDDGNHFYQTRYKEGFTTECPSDEQLRHLLASQFLGSPRDYSSYIRILKSAGLQPGDTVLDFGCSWGYGSWQFREAGFEVYSFEISAPRANYAKTKLGCQVVANLADIPERVKCFFSAHVLEHLPDPNVLWETAKQVIDDEGTIVCITPNGEPALELTYGSRRYHELWGKVHPLLLTVKALKEMASRHGMFPHIFTSPYDARLLQCRNAESELGGEELLLIGHLNSTRCLGCNS